MCFGVSFTRVVDDNEASEQPNNSLAMRLVQDVPGGDVSLIFRMVPNGQMSFFFGRGRYISGWWFQICFIFTPIWGNDEILTNIFQRC